MALLSGVRNAKNHHLSQEIYNRMRKIFPQLSDPITSAAILLANVYGSVGDFEKASDIRDELNQFGMKKKIGLTWTVIDENIHVS